MTDQSTGNSTVESLSSFLAHSVDSPSTTLPTEKFDEKQESNDNNEMKTITMKKKTNYWMSDEAKKKKQAYGKQYYQRMKEKQQAQLELLEELKSKQITGCSITLMNVNGKTSTRAIHDEQDYLTLIDDLITSLVDNGLVADYSIDAL